MMPTSSCRRPPSDEPVARRGSRVLRLGDFKVKALSTIYKSALHKWGLPPPTRLFVKGTDKSQRDQVFAKIQDLFYNEDIVVDSVHREGLHDQVKKMFATYAADQTLPSVPDDWMGDGSTSPERSHRTPKENGPRDRDGARAEVSGGPDSQTPDNDGVGATPSLPAPDKHGVGASPSPTAPDRHHATGFNRVTPWISGRYTKGLKLMAGMEIVWHDQMHIVGTPESQHRARILEIKMEEQGQNDLSERLVLSTNDYLDDNWLIQRVGRTAAGKQTAAKGAGDHLRRSSSRPGRGDSRVIDKDQTECGVPAGYDVLNDSDGGPDEIRCPIVTSDQSDTEDDNDDDNGHDNSYGNGDGNDEQFGRAPLGRTRRMEECDDDDGNGDGNDDVVAVEVRPASGTSPADSSEGVSVAKPPPTATLNMPSSLSGTKQPGNPGYLPSRTSTSTCGGAPDAMSPSGAYAGRTSGSCNGERPKEHAVGTPGGKVATKGGRNAKGKKEGKGKGKAAASTAGGGKATPGRRTVTPEERKKMKEMAGRISEAAQAEHDRAYRSWADQNSRPSTYGTSGMDPFTATAAKRVKAAWTGAGGSSAFGTQGHGNETAYEIAGSPRTNAVEQSRIDQNTPGNPSDISAKVAESLRTLQSHAPDLLSPMEGGNTRRRQSPMERGNPDPAKGLGSGGGPDRPNGFDGQSGPVGSPVGYGDAAGLDKSRCRALETGGEDRHPGRTPASWSSLHERANWTDDGRSLKPAVASPALPYPRARDAMYQYNDEYRFDEYGRPGWTHDADGFDRRGFNRSGVNVRGFDITGRRPDPARSEFSGQHGIRDVEGHATTRKRDHFASLSGGALPVVGSAVDGPWSGATPLVAGGKSEACSGAGQPSGEEEDVPLREFRRLTAEVKPYRFATRDTLRAWKQAYDLLKKTRHVLGRPGITAILNGRGKADPLVLGCSRQTADRWADASVAIDVCHDEKCCAADANVADRLQRHPVIPRAKKG